MKIVVALLAGLSLLLLTALPVWADPVLDDIENEFMCQCGCSLTLPACAGTMTCDVGQQMRGLITTKIARGDSKDQIVKSLVSQYGEKILASPPKQGFSLTAWVVPFAAVIGGGAFIYLLLRAWMRNASTAGATTTMIAPVSDEDRQRYQAAFEKEYEQFRTLEEGR